MTRPPEQPLREDIPEEELEAYDAVTARARRMAGEEPEPGQDYRIGKYFGSLLNSPPMAQIAAQMGTFVRTAGERSNSYSHADREFVDQVLSADWKTNVVQKLHIPDALSAGVRMEAIEALRYGREENLDEDERLLAHYIRGVVGGAVTDELYARMEERLGRRGLVEYTGFILWLQWIIRMMQTLGMPDPADAEIDQLIEELKSGNREDADFRARLH